MPTEADVICRIPERESFLTRILPDGRVLDVYVQLFNAKLTIAPSIDSWIWLEGW